MTDPLDLETRDGLPDALRVLLADYPRLGWEADPAFDGLVRFWLDRHLMFRRLCGLIGEDAEALIDRRIEEAAYGQRLARLGSTLVGELHGHHMIEDTHYFPALARTEPQIEQGFSMLDRDHQALDRHIESFTGTANVVLRAISEGGRPREAAATFLAGHRRLEALLDRHLVDEEELVVPVILKHGASGLG